MRAFLDGRYGLGPTFFGGVVGGWIAFRLAGLIFTGNPLQMSLQEIDRLATGHRILAVIAALYGLAMLRAVWRAADGEDGRRPIGWIATGAAAVVAAVTVHVALIAAFPATFTTRAVVELEIAEVNRSLPQRVGHPTVLPLTIEDEVVVHRHRSDRILPEEQVAILEGRLSIETPEARQLCAESETYFRSGIVGFRYEYAFANREVIVEHTAADCARVLAENR